MDAGGENQKQLTMDSRRNYDPAVSSGGRYIVFVSNRAGPENLWRMEMDGRNQTLLTHKGAGRPDCSSNDRWVVFASADSLGNPRISRVSIEGGNPVQLTNHTSGRPVIYLTGSRLLVATSMIQMNKIRVGNTQSFRLKVGSRSRCLRYHQPCPSPRALSGLPTAR